MTDAVKDAARRTPQEILCDRRCTDEELLSLSHDDLLQFAEAILHPLESGEALKAAVGNRQTMTGDD